MTSLKSDLWWPSASTASIFMLPPFPGSRVILNKKENISPPRTFGDDEIGNCIAAIRHFHVGGTYWARQPELPADSYILARPANPLQFAEMKKLAANESARAIYWFPDEHALRIAGAPVGNSVVGPCDPWHLLTSTSQLWSDQDDVISFFAAILGVPQRLFDADPAPERSGSVQAIDPQTIMRKLLQDDDFRDPFSGKAIAPSALLKTLGFWRDLIETNRPIAAIYGVAFWKRASIAPLLWNGDGGVPFENLYRKLRDARHPWAAAWIARTKSGILQKLHASGTPIAQIEDGFIRSVGLGADCVPPLSIVVDSDGAHYDPAQPSGLETILATHQFMPEMLGRSQRLRKLIVAQGISKYGIGAAPFARAGGSRRHILVTGQVEDDQSVLKGGGGIASNFELLRRVRVAEPDAFIIYRPHPDVDAGHRKGYIDDNVVLGVADSIAREVAITSLIDVADNIHVLTSLAGFEALMRGKPVTTHGVPFYAGWGLTTDLGPVPARRQRKLSLDELVAATLLIYPRYLDPKTGLPCPPEVLIERLSSGYRKTGMLVATRRILGSLTRRARNLRLRRISRERVR